MGLAGGGGEKQADAENSFHCVSNIRAHYGFNFGKCPLTDTELQHDSTPAKCHRGDVEHRKHGCLPPTSVVDWNIEITVFKLHARFKITLTFKAVKSTKHSRMCPFFLVTTKLCKSLALWPVA